MITFTDPAIRAIKQRRIDMDLDLNPGDYTQKILVRIGGDATYTPEQFDEIKKTISQVIEDAHELGALDQIVAQLEQARQ